MFSAKTLRKIQSCSDKELNHVFHEHLVFAKMLRESRFGYTDIIYTFDERVPKETIDYVKNTCKRMGYVLKDVDDLTIRISWKGDV